MKWVVLPCSEPYTEETKLHTNHLYIFSLDYMPVFLPNLRLMCPHPYGEDLWFLADITTYKILFQSTQHTDIMWWIFVFVTFFKYMLTLTYWFSIQYRSPDDDLYTRFFTWYNFIFIFEIWVLRAFPIMPIGCCKKKIVWNYLSPSLKFDSGATR